MSKLEDFETTNGSVKDGTLAHVLERVFGCVVCSEGFCIKGFDRDYKFEYQERIRSCMKFIYSRKDTKNNYRLVKLFKIPVYYRKIL